MKIQYLAFLQALVSLAFATPVKQFTVSINIDANDSPNYDYCNLKCTHDKLECPQGYVCFPFPAISLMF